MIIGKIENALERGFVKHRLNCLLITDTWSPIPPLLISAITETMTVICVEAWFFFFRLSIRNYVSFINSFMQLKNMPFDIFHVQPCGPCLTFFIFQAHARKAEQQANVQHIVDKETAGLQVCLVM